MLRLSGITYLWPGLTRLWWRGHFPSLAMAVAFSLLVNLLLLNSMWQPDLLAPVWSWVGWAVCLVIWCSSLWEAVCQGRGHDASASAQNQKDLLNLAQAEYLKGQWSSAQTMLEQQIRRNPEDVESLLLLSSVFRRSGQIEPARRKLDQAMRLEGANRWRHELQREKQLLDRNRSTSPAEAAPGG